jgi:hypothetical protein
MATENRQAGDHMVAGLDVGDIFTDRFDHTCGFMTKYGGHWRGVFAFDEMQVAVAKPADTGTHQHFVALGFFDLDALDGHRLTWAMKNSGFHVICSCGL